MERMECFIGVYEFLVTPSNVEIGAILSQDTIKQDKQVGYASRTVNESEQR